MRACGGTNRKETKMTVLEALMAAGLFVAPQPVYQVKPPSADVYWVPPKPVDWPDPSECKVSVCGLIPNVYDPDAKVVVTTKEPPVFGKIPGDVVGGPLPSELRRFNDELATVPGAFVGAMKEDKPGLKELAEPIPLPRPQPPTTEGKGGE